MQVQARFGDEHRIHLDAFGEGFSMVELYVHLFQGWEHKADMEQWGRKTTVLHSALHEKISRAKECSVCGGSRLWQDSRWQHSDWSFKLISLLWDLTVRTIREHGTG